MEIESVAVTRTVPPCPGGPPVLLVICAPPVSLKVPTSSWMAPASPRPLALFAWIRPGPAISTRGAAINSMPPRPVPACELLNSPLGVSSRPSPAMEIVSVAVTRTVPACPGPLVLLAICPPSVRVTRGASMTTLPAFPAPGPEVTVVAKMPLWVKMLLPSGRSPRKTVSVTVIESVAVTRTVPPCPRPAVLLVICAPPVSLKVPTSSWMAPASPRLPMALFAWIRPLAISTRGAATNSMPPRPVPASASLDSTLGLPLKSSARNGDRVPRDYRESPALPGARRAAADLCPICQR